MARAAIRRRRSADVDVDHDDDTRAVAAAARSPAKRGRFDRPLGVLVLLALFAAIIGTCVWARHRYAPLAPEHVLPVP